MELRELQQGFLSYLLSTESGSIIQQIESTELLSASERLDIYANAYRLRLKEALSIDYEILHSYLGDEQFDLITSHYITQYPSHTDSLRYFSLDLPNMLRDVAPFNGLPQLYELALIEQNFANSFDALDAEIITLDQLANMAPEHWPNLRLEFSPSQQILQLNTNSFELWKALSNESSPPEVVFSNTPQAWVVWRKADLISHYRALDNAEHAALTAAANGEDFSSLCEILLAFFDEDKVPHRAVGFLQSWIVEERLTGLFYGPQAVV